MIFDSTKTPLYEFDIHVPEPIEHGPQIIFADVVDHDFDMAAAEEMRKIIEYAVLENRSRRELVITDYTHCQYPDDRPKRWPIADYNQELGGWQRVSYDDGRPYAGVITINSVRSRYISNDENQIGNAPTKYQVSCCASIVLIYQSIFLAT